MGRRLDLESQTKTPTYEDVGLYNFITKTFINYKAGKSMRRLVLLAMKEYVNVRLDGRARQQNNVNEMAVREQGAMARLRVLQFGEELFATVGAAKPDYDALNMHNVFRKIPRREGDVAEKDSGDKL